MFKQPLLLLGAFAVASNFPVSFGVVSTDVTDAFDHRFKGGWSESPPLKGQTAFERKHGILPGGVGFVYDHPGVNNHTVDSLVKELGASAATTDVQGAVCQQLQGLFVRPCESQYQYEGMNVTSYDTRYYSTSSTYELDRTYYIGGGAKCQPSTNDLFFKMNLHGTVAYHGYNSAIGSAGAPWQQGACKAQMLWENSTIYLGNNALGSQLASLFQANCPCGITWSAGNWYNVSTSKCAPLTMPQSSPAYVWCHLIANGTDYFNYQWDRNLTHYITSYDYFDPDFAWTQHLIPSYIREKIPSTGNNDPCACEGLCSGNSGIALWERCGQGVYDAESACRGCIGLECDGCLFREIDPQWNPLKDNNNWQDCCPCIYLYANKAGNNWAQPMC
eukprot:m.740370 g.740370  ORF g.740370 m.740370 type:complete len:389 (+) comp23114_c1_seq3:192-1358(+)